MSRFLDHTQLHTHTHTHKRARLHPVGPLWKSDQHVADAATYTTQNEFKTVASMPSAGFELSAPAAQLHGH